MDIQISQEKLEELMQKINSLEETVNRQQKKLEEQEELLLRQQQDTKTIHDLLMPIYTNEPIEKLIKNVEMACQFSTQAEQCEAHVVKIENGNVNIISYDKSETGVLHNVTDTPLGKSLLEGKTVFLNNSEDVSVGDNSVNKKNKAIVPLKDNNDNVIAAIVLQDDKKEFIKKDTELLNSRDGYIGMTFCTGIQFKKIGKLAYRDTLTNLLNLNGLENYMVDNLYEQIKNASPEPHCAVIETDIDHFKNFNDTYGHDIGDEVLKAVAKTIEKTVGSNGIVARKGGEEFITILPNVTEEMALKMGEKIRLAVEEQCYVPVSTTTNERSQVTISVGVSPIPFNSKTAETLELPIVDPNEVTKQNIYQKIIGISIGDVTPFKRADDALYMAKERGRNRVYSNTEIMQKYNFYSVPSPTQQFFEYLKNINYSIEKTDKGYILKNDISQESYDDMPLKNMSDVMIALKEINEENVAKQITRDFKAYEGEIPPELQGELDLQTWANVASNPEYEAIRNDLRNDYKNLFEEISFADILVNKTNEIHIDRIAQKILEQEKIVDLSKAQLGAPTIQNDVINIPVAMNEDIENNMSKQLKGFTIEETHINITADYNNDMTLQITQGNKLKEIALTPDEKEFISQKLNIDISKTIETEREKNPINFEQAYNDVENGNGEKSIDANIGSKLFSMKIAVKSDERLEAFKRVKVEDRDANYSNGKHYLDYLKSQENNNSPDYLTTKDIGLRVHINPDLPYEKAVTANVFINTPDDIDRMSKHRHDYPFELTKDEYKQVVRVANQELKYRGLPEINIPAQQEQTQEKSNMIDNRRTKFDRTDN